MSLKIIDLKLLPHLTRVYELINTNYNYDIANYNKVYAYSIGCTQPRYTLTVSKI